MQNVGQTDNTDPSNDDKSDQIGQTNVTSSSSSSVMENTPTEQQNFVELSASEEEEVSEVESFILEQEELDCEGESVLDTSQFLLASENLDGSDLRSVDPETQAKLEALLEAAGIGKLSTADGKAFADPEVLRRLTSSVSCALDEAAQALTRMRAEQQGDSMRSLAEACSDGDIGTVRKLLDEGRSVHETTEEGESLLSLACSAGYYELAQVLLAMRANVEDRGIKGDCTPLMEAASGGHVDIVKLLIEHGADVNAQSSAGNTPLHYAACGGYDNVVMVLLMAGANEEVEEHNENGHTPLMEAASAGHVDVARTLLKAGAGINTHSNEFKESALTLACYKGHLEMVKFLLQAGADQEHKTDEMHTALMEASMDGHVEVARLLLDSGAQVNMPADSFESPLTLAACGGHVELANLLIERGANLEEVNDEGYTPLMEAAREGHDEMVALLLAHGADINAQTEETQETALTLACCGGFQEVAEFLIKAGADLELGCSTPLMEAAQEGHLDLVRFLIDEGAKVNAQTGTGDTALTYACENGHTDVADVLIKAGADLHVFQEHESEGGRTPLMKAARAGHLCTVQFLISKGADVNRQTSTNDHTVLSLACAGGHMAVVELLLTHGADPTHKLKDGSTMLIEAAKGGHTAVVNLLLEWPNNVLSTPPDLTQLSPPDNNTATTEAPRVPMQGLNNIVPPQDPDQIPSATPLPVPSTAACNTLHTGISTSVGTIVPGQLNLKDMNLPTRSTEQIRQNMQKSLLRNKPPPAKPEQTSLAVLPPTVPYLSTATNMLLTPCIGTPTSSTALVTTPTAPPFNVDTSITQNVVVSAATTLVSTPGASAGVVVPTLLSTYSAAATAPTLLPVVPATLHTVSSIAMPVPTSASSMMTVPLAFPASLPTLLPHTTTVTEVSGNGVTGFDFTKALAESGIQVPLPVIATASPSGDTSHELKLDAKTTEKCEKLEAFINNMMRKAELLNTTREEQIVKKQQILEELQKVERELHEKAQAQLLFNFQQRLDPAPPAPPPLCTPAPPPLTTLPNLAPPLLATATPLNQAQLVQLQQQQLRLEQLQQLAPGQQQTNILQVPLSMAMPMTQLAQLAPLTLPLTADAQSLTDSLKNSRNVELSAAEVHGAGHGAHGTGGEAMPGNLVDVMLTPPPPPVREKKKAKRSLKLQQQQQQMVAAGLTGGASGDSSPIKMGAAAAEAGSSAESSPSHTVLGSGAASQSARPIQATSATSITALTAAGSSVDRESRASSEEVDLTSVMPVGSLSDCGQSAAKQAKVELCGTSETIGLSKSTCTLPAIQWDPSALAKLQGLPLPPVLTSNAAASLFDPQQFAQLTAQQNTNYTIQQVQAEYQQKLQLQEYQAQLDAHQHLQQHVALTLGQQQHQQVVTASHIQLTQHGLAQGKFTIPTQGLVPVAPLSQQELFIQTQQLAQLQQSGVLQAGVSGAGLAPHTTTISMEMWQALQKSGAVGPAIAQRPGQPLISQANLAPGSVAAIASRAGFTIGQPGLAMSGGQMSMLPTSTPAQVVPNLVNLQQASIAPQPAKKAKKKLGPLGGPPLTTAVLPPLAGSPIPATPPLLSHQYSFPAVPPASGLHSLDTITPPPSTPLTPNPSPVSPVLNMPAFPSLELDAQTESNHDTALTFACAGGHADLVSLLLSRGADIEHRDKKGFTPLILAATAGHADVTEILLDHGADIEAQSERTKDTPLSLACSGGRYEVVEFLLARGANKEHRNVSDYTPLSLAASGGYVNIIKLLLSHGAEINSRTGSKLGISPLMLAAMNGHTAAVKLLLDMGSDINAQIETNRNTALTLACFQGRHEVVSLLVDRKANIEHRAKTGLTPLMEAASGGYVEVGRVLLDKVADVNAPPVPSSRDTALTIAADKGHYRFVELLLARGAAVDVKNKKGNSPLWLACNGGHLDVVQLLVNAAADVDSQDNRKVSCLMSSFRKGHVKVVKWLVKHVMQFPSDQECMRYIATITDKELLKKCHQCMEILVSAKDRQAAQANKNASILLEELDLERSRQETKKAALARKRERRKKKKKEKQEKEQKDREDKDDDKGTDSKNSSPEPEDDNDDDDKDDSDDALDPPPEPVPRVAPPTPAPPPPPPSVPAPQPKKEVVVVVPEVKPSVRSASSASKRAKNEANAASSATIPSTETNNNIPTITPVVLAAPVTAKTRSKKRGRTAAERNKDHRKESGTERILDNQPPPNVIAPPPPTPAVTVTNNNNITIANNSANHNNNTTNKKNRSKSELANAITGVGELDEFSVAMNNTNVSASPRGKDKNTTRERNIKSSSNTLEIGYTDVPAVSPAKNKSLKSPGGAGSLASPKRGLGQKCEDAGWKEVTRKPPNVRSKKVMVSSTAVSRVIGRGGQNINAIREVSGAHIELDKQKGQGDRSIVIKGSADAIKQAHMLIASLVREPDKELDQIIPNRKGKQPVGAADKPSNTFSSSMWQNSMAAHIPTCSTNVGTCSAPGTPAASRAAPSKTSSTSTSRTSVVANGSTISAQPTIQFSQLVSGATAASLVANTASPSKKLNGAGMMKTTGPPCGQLAFSAMHPCSNQDIAKQVSVPAAIVRELFPKEPCSSQPSASTAKTTLTYCTAAMTATKVVSTGSPSFAAKVDSRTVMTTNVQTSRPTASKISAISTTLNPIASICSRPIESHPITVPPRPSPRPIATSAVYTTQQPSSSPSRSAQSAVQPPCTTTHVHPGSLGSEIQFSPFNNRLSSVAERVLCKKEDYASIASTGVIPTTASALMQQMQPEPTQSTPDPMLEAKAPGYKPSGQHTSSAHINEAAKAPGYRGNSSLSSSMPSPALSHSQPRMFDMNLSDSQPVICRPDLAQQHPDSVSLDMTGGLRPDLAVSRPDPNVLQYLANIRQIQCQQESLANRAPGYRGNQQVGMDPNDPSACQNTMMFEMSPRSVNNPAGMGFGSGLPRFHDHRPTEEEYSRPHQPMTLPKIESSLNPNAPQFTSRALDRGGAPDFPSRSQFTYQQLLMMQQYQALGSAAPQLNLAPGSGPSPGIGGPQPLNVNQPPFLAMPDMMAYLGGSGAAATRQLSPGPPGAPPSSHPPGHCQHSPPNAQDGSPGSASDLPPSSSSTPSPADTSPRLNAGPQDTAPERLLPQPIGAGRNRHKVPEQSSTAFPDTASMASSPPYWAFPNDLGGEAFSGTASVTSVLTTTVVATTLISTATLSADQVECIPRPASLPPAMSPHLLGTGGFPPSVASADTPLDQAQIDAHVQMQLHRQTMMLASTGPPPVLSNGLPGSVSTPTAALFGQPSMAGDVAWPQTLKPNPDQPIMDQKLMWNNWNSTGNL